MKVRELIEQLEGMDPEAQVHFSYNYGDHCRTTVAPAVRHVEESRVRHSDYHSMDAVIDEEDSSYDTAQEVVLLRS